MNFDLLYYAFQEVVVTHAIIYLILGVALGVTFGIIPGLGGTTALALLIPFTYNMEPFDAMMLAGGVTTSNLPFRQVLTRQLDLLRPAPDPVRIVDEPVTGCLKIARAMLSGRESN